MTELFATAVWAIYLARIAFSVQTIKLAPVMRNLRQGVVPAALIAMALGTVVQAQVAGSAMPEDSSRSATVYRDGISLDEAVRQAEAQYHARVVRTDVQDEDGRKVYVLKLLTENGRVITVRIDASSGRSR